MSIKRSTITAVAVGLLAAALGAAPALAAPAPEAAVATTTSAHHRLDQVFLPDGFQPEGIASISRTFFSGSVADGRIWRGDLITGNGAVLVPSVPGRSLRGMQVDRRTGLLWTTGSEGATGIVLAVDSRTGTVVRRIEVPGAGFLNDLVLTRRTVWVTDSNVDRLTAVPLGAARPAHGRVRAFPPAHRGLAGDACGTARRERDPCTSGRITRAEQHLGGWSVHRRPLHRTGPSHPGQRHSGDPQR